MMLTSNNQSNSGLSWLAARRNAKRVDEKGNTLMTLAYLKQLSKEQKGYMTPELNDVLYLHFKGSLS
jgi:hypothetical protein